MEIVGSYSKCLIHVENYSVRNNGLFRVGVPHSTAAPCYTYEEGYVGFYKIIGELVHHSWR